MPFDVNSDIRLSMDQNFAIKSISKDGDIAIEGWFVTETPIECYNLLVKAKAFKAKDSMKMFNGRVLAFHNQDTGPIGETIALDVVEGKGLRGRVLIWKENADLLKRGITSGVLSAFSIGFRIKKYEVDEDSGLMTVTEAMLKEVSVVNIGADSNALFEIKQNLSSNHITITRSPKIMSDEKKEFDPTLFMTEQEKLGADVVELQNMLTAIKETQSQASKNLITKAEVAQRLEKFSEALETLKTQIEENKAAKTLSDSKLAFTDYRSTLSIPWLTDENGNKVTALEQKAYCLFQAPVDYEKMANGNDLKNLRNLHDAVLIADAMARYKARDRHNMRKLMLFQQLCKATEQFDKDVALAMAGGNTGYGAEWLPTDMSSEFADYLRVQPMLPSKIQTWLMPRGGSAKFPFQNGRAVVYKGSEALVDNAEEARKTNVATGVKTFTPETFIGALVASEELTEDTILDMVAFIRKELATALLEGLESAICNGDDSATHFDNTTSTTYQSYQVETSFKGIRKLSIANTAQAADTVNGLVLSDFVAAKQLMAVAGLVPQDCLYVTGIKGKAAVQAALFASDALGVLAFMLSGTVPNIDGSEVYISGQYNEGLDSEGYVHSGGVKYTSMTCIHKPSFRIGQRRGVTLEFAKNILTQQQQFVATARYDFGKVCADAIAPAAAIIRMKHTT